MILSIPIFMLWNLRISLKKKIGVMLLLSAGLFVITIALIRIIVTLTSSASALTINRVRHFPTYLLGPGPSDLFRIVI